MPFPSGLTLVTVACQFDLPNAGGAAGQVQIRYDGPLTGPTADSIVPYVEVVGTLDPAGHCVLTVPATNDPQWTPQNFAYDVWVQLRSRTKIRGTLQLDYHTTSVNLADLIQWDGLVVAGQTYIPLSLRGAAGGVAALDATGDVVDASGVKLLDPGVSGITRDTQGRTTGYTAAGQVWSAITYDSSGRVSAFTVDGVAHAVSYNASGQITGVA